MISFHLQSNHNDTTLQVVQNKLEHLNIARHEILPLSEKWGFVGRCLEKAGMALGVYSPPYPVFDKGCSPPEKTSKDVWRTIFSLGLSLKDIASLSETSKTMQAICKKFLLNAKIESITYGAKAWKKILGCNLFNGSQLDFREPPRPNHDELENASNFFKDKKVDDTCRLILIPGGLSLAKINTLLSPPLTKFRFTGVIKGLGKKKIESIKNKQVEKSYWALITTKIITGSRKKTYEQGYEILLERGKHLYDVPRVIEATLLPLLEKCMNPIGEDLLYYGDWTARHTTCIEPFENEHYQVGGLSEKGVKIFYGNVVHKSCVGILAVKRYLPSDPLPIDSILGG